jgi:two-component system, OmpR family, sensor kinase
MKDETKTIDGHPDTAGDGFFNGVDVEFIIHELKDPIAVIETALRLLLERTEKYGPLTPRQEKTLSRALRNSKKAGRLLADLLEVGRADNRCCLGSTFTALPVVHAAVLESLEAVAPALWETLGVSADHPLTDADLDRCGIRIGCSDAAHGVDLCQDENKFRQIVGNLIKNALHHRRRRLEIRLNCNGGRLILEVADDGPGVAKADRELIFKRYTRLDTSAPLSRSGHGLGLAGARILARRLGGDITIVDGSGAGAVFCLELPLSLDALHGDELF